MAKILLLTIDALRYDYLHSDRVDTPNMDRVVEAGRDCSRAFANGPGTPAAFPAILYSSLKNEGPGAPNGRSIAERLSDAGYETVGVTANPYLSGYYGYGEEFDTFVDFITPTREKAERSLIYRLGRRVVRSVEPVYDWLTSWRAENDLPYERAEVLNDEALEHLEAGADQFLWIHYMEPHSPYSPPEEYREMCGDAWERRGELAVKFNDRDVDEADIDDLETLYRGEIKYLDDEIGRLLDAVEAMGDEVHVVLTADHGEMMGERGLIAHGHPFNPNLQVPLVFDLPGMDGTEDGLASHLDLLPTLLARLDLPSEGCEGIDLVEESRDSLTVALPDGNVVVTDEWKLIDFDDERYLFDISESMEETDNLFDERPEVVERLRDLAETKATAGLDI